MYELLTPAVGIFLTQASPGQNMTAVMSIAFGSGRKAGVIAATGIALGVFVWSVIFWIGFGAVLETYPEALNSIKLLGGGYVFFLGIKALTISMSPAGLNIYAKKRTATGSRAFRAGLLVAMTNPNTALLWAVVSMFVASANFSEGILLIIGVFMSISAIIIYSVYAIMFSTAYMTRAYGRLFRYIEAAFGLFLGAIGWKLMTDVLNVFR